MPAGHDPTVIIRTRVNPYKAIPDNSSAWRRMKSSVSNALAVPAAETSNTKFVEFGNNGEIVVAYHNTIEVWDWIAPSSQRKVRYCGGTLFLTATHTIDNNSGNIVLFKPLNCYRDHNHYVLVLCLEVKKDYFFKVVSFGPRSTETKPLVLPPVSFGGFPYSIKNSEKFYVISTNDGCLSIFNKASSQNPLSDMTIQAKMFDGKPLFDLSGRWFVYVPSNTKEILQNLKKLNCKKSKGDLSQNEEVTPLKLPKSGTLLSKFIDSLSSTALDGALKLSEIGTNKVKSYLLNQEIPADNSLTREQLKNIKSSLLNLINVNNSPSKSSSQFVVIMDLVVEEPLAIFSPPGNISNISLSPYDTHLATSSTRGDNVYVWDLSRIPKEVSLIAKHNRGMTASSIDQILWSVGNSSIGIVTRASGSLHWFNNYARSTTKASGWLLSGLKAKKLSLGPHAAEESVPQKQSCLSNSDSIEFKDNQLLTRGQFVKSCILAVDSQEETITVISPEDGGINRKYLLPETAVPSHLLPEYLKPQQHRKLTHNTLPGQHVKEPLSNVEIQTCESFPPLYFNRKVQFGVYNFSTAAKFKETGKDNDLQYTTEPLDHAGRFICVGKSSRQDQYNFKNNYSTFGSGFTADLYQFSKSTGLPVFNGYTDKEDGLVELMDSEDSSGPLTVEDEAAGLKNLQTALQESLLDSKNYD